MYVRDNRFRWVALLLATLVQVGVSLLQQAPAALGPLLSQDLGLSRVQLGSLSSAVIGGMLLTTLPAGILIDRRGERLVVAIGVGTMALLVLLASQANTFGWLFVFLLLASFGGSTSTPGGSKAIAGWFPRSRRGMALGVRQTGVPAGGLLAAIVLPPFAVAFGWRAGLEAGAAATVVCALFFAVLFRDPRGEREVDENPSSVPDGLIGKTLRDRGFLAASSYSLVLVAAQWATVTYLTLFLYEHVGVPVVVAGALLSVLQVGGIVGRVGWGAVSDTLGRRKAVLILVALIAMVCCLAMAFVGRSVPLPLLVILLATLGLTLLGWNGLYVTVLAESTSSRAATALGAGLTITNTGSLAGPPLFGLLIDSSNSYQVFWLVLAGWIFIGALLGFFVREPYQEAEL